MKIVGAIIILGIIIFAAQVIAKIITGKSPNDPVTSHAQGWFYIWVFALAVIGVALYLFGELREGWVLLVYVGVTIPAFAALGHFAPRIASLIVRDEQKKTLRGSISTLIFFSCFLTVVFLLGKLLAKHK